MCPVTSSGIRIFWSGQMSTMEKVGGWVMEPFTKQPIIILNHWASLNYFGHWAFSKSDPDGHFTFHTKPSSHFFADGLFAIKIKTLAKVSIYLEWDPHAQDS